MLLLHVKLRSGWLRSGKRRLLFLGRRETAGEGGGEGLRKRVNEGRLLLLPLNFWDWSCCNGIIENIIEIEIYPLQKGGLRTSFPRWGVTVLCEEGCMLVGPIVAPISTMA